MNRAYIIPTGDEIAAGTVLDLDSPEVMRVLLRAFPRAQVVRIPPVTDTLDGIIEALNGCLREGAELIVLIGGSGGGHRYVKTLGQDFTHTALEAWLEERAVREIWGKNGHLWSKLICGRREGTLVINIPGPFTEASAAIQAFVRVYARGGSLEELNAAIVAAVIDQYPC